MAFAVGKYSEAICDRCGFQYKYLELKEEWNGLLVCEECYEPKHPQLEPTYASADAEALQNPRPQVSLPMTVEVGAPNDTYFNSDGMQPSQRSRNLIMVGSVGTVSIVIS
jgi:NAD-dependent SIR2 family protein deacetylase